MSDTTSIHWPAAGTTTWQPSHEGMRAAFVGDSFTVPTGELAALDGCEVDGRTVTIASTGPGAFAVDGKRYVFCAWSTNAATWLAGLNGGEHVTTSGAPLRNILTGLARCDSTARDAAVTEADAPHGGLAGRSLHRYGLARRRTDPGAQ